MAEIKIKNESLPSRCEICHQADQFDPAANYCARCSTVPQVQSSMPIRIVAKAATLTDIELGIAVGMPLGALLAVSVFLIFAKGELDWPILFVPAYIGMCLGGIHGVIVGMILSRSITGTDGASGLIAPRVITSAVSNIRNRPGLSKFNGLFSGALAGISVILPIILLITLLSWNFDFILASWRGILAWLLITAINGAPIGFVCQNRPDRRTNASYLHDGN
jgi:hypothetical protein